MSHLRQLLRRNNFLLQQFRWHGGTGDNAERPRIAECGDQVALAHPAHRPAHNGVFAAQQIASALPESSEIVHVYPVFVCKPAL